MRWVEFFEGEGNRLSMTRLLCFLAFWPASYVFLHNPSEGMAWAYLGTFVGGYAAGKWADKMGGKHVDNSNRTGE